MANAMTAAANNPAGGGASDGMGLAMGMAMANQMMGMNQPPAAGGAAVPPPPPSGPMFHVSTNGQTQGPFNMQQMASGVSQGQITPETMVWSQGMSGWLPASQVPQLANCFGATPPPPPPPPAS